MTQKNSNQETKLSDKDIKDKLKGLYHGKDVFIYLGDLWLVKRIINKKQYNDFYYYWIKNRPEAVKREMNNKERQLFGDMVDSNTKIEELK